MSDLRELARKVLDKHYHRDGRRSRGEQDGTINGYTPMNRIQALPNRYPNHFDELTFLRAFASAVAKATELKGVPGHVFNDCMATAEAIEEMSHNR